MKNWYIPSDIFLSPGSSDSPWALSNLEIALTEGAFPRSHKPSLISLEHTRELTAGKYRILKTDNQI